MLEFFALVKKKITSLKIPENLLGSGILLLLATTTFSGCEVFVNFGLKGTTLEMYSAIIPGSQTNMAIFLLPGYKDNDPNYRYIIDFYGGDKCRGQYYAADTLSYEVEGVWTLPTPNVIRIKLDAFIEADFDISKLDKHTYLLITESNVHGLSLLPEPTTALHLYVRKVY